MAEENFSDIGRVEAIARLYEGTPFHPAENLQFETGGKASVASASRMLLEGIDLDEGPLVVSAEETAADTQPKAAEA